MSRKIHNPRNFNSGSILIVCEGQKTENYFISKLFRYLKDRNLTPIDSISISPFPEPDDEDHRLDRELRERGFRDLVNNPGLNDVKYPIPLNWVMKAYNELKVYSEAWVLFDHDDHPARKDAFEKVLEARINESKNLNLAFSSRSFEYFMLQHFELIFHPFRKTECRNHDYGQLNCCGIENGGPLPGACDGLLENDCCINGYARLHGYWENSKCSNVFTIIPNLWKGIVNSTYIKWQSINQNRTHDLYDRNPFLNSYRIVLRFLDLIPIEQDIITIISNNVLIIHEGTNLRVINKSKYLFLLSERYQSVFRIGNNTDKLSKEFICNLPRLFIEPQQEGLISLDCLTQNHDYFLIIKIDNKKYFVTSSNIIDPPLDNLEKKNLDLSYKPLGNIEEFNL